MRVTRPRLESFYSKLIFIALAVIFTNSKSPAQNYEAKSVLYNSLVGAITGGVGAIINKSPQEKWGKVLLKGFTGGAVGGTFMYAGKKTNYLINKEQNISYAWLSRLVFSVGNSIVENAAYNKGFFSRFHFDIGFIRIDLYTDQFKIMPRLMPSVFCGILFIGLNGRFDAETSLRSGTVTFRTKSISYAPYLIGSTTGNGFLLNDTLVSGVLFHEIFAHEMIHTFQFLEQSGFNAFFKPVSDNWKSKSKTFNKLNKYIHGDLNYELMLANYFIIQGGYRRTLYCRNYLENEAEVLSTRRVSCPMVDP